MGFHVLVQSPEPGTWTARLGPPRSPQSRHKQHRPLQRGWPCRASRPGTLLLSSSSRPESAPSLISSSLLGAPRCFPRAPSTGGVSSNCPQLSLVSSRRSVSACYRHGHLSAEREPPAHRREGLLTWLPPRVEGSIPQGKEVQGWGLAQTCGPGERGGQEGRGEPRGVSFRANLGKREQRPMHHSPASPPSCHLGLKSHLTAPAWTSQSCGAGRGLGTLGFEEGLRRRPRKQSALCLLFPDLNWGTSGAPKGTASTWQASGGRAPLLGQRCPPPPCRTSCAAGT